MQSASLTLGTSQRFGELPVLSQNQYNRFKSHVLNNKPITGVLDFSKINFEDSGKISYVGEGGKSTLLNVTDSAITKLVGELGINNKFSPGQKQTRSLILNVLKTFKTNAKMNFVMNESGEIHTITKSASKLVPYETFFNLFERAMNSSNELEMNSLSFDEGNSSLMLNIRSTHQLDAGGSSEIFNTGITFENRMKGFGVSPFLLRLVCTNGMVSSAPDHCFRTNSLDQISVPLYLNYMDKLRNNNFIPTGFTEKWKSANSTQASLAEVLQTRNLIKSNVEDSDMDIFIPGFFDVMEKFTHAYGDCELLDNDTQKMLRTPIMVSDCVNAITDAGSHNGAENVRKLQVAGGNMLNKTTFDTAKILTQLF